MLAVAAPAQAEIEEQPLTLGAGQSGSTTLTCRGVGNVEVISGGALTTTPLVKVWASYPGTDSSWTVSATNFASTTQTINVRVQCDADVQSYWRQAKNVSIGINGIGDAVAVCPAGRTSMGGGWLAPDAGVSIVASRAQGSNGWQVRARNFDSGGSSVTSFVTCVGAIGPRHVEPWVTTVGANGISNPTRGCSSGWIASGGFSVTDDSGFTVVTASLPSRNFSINSDMWKWNFKNWDTVAHTIEQTLVCFD